MIIIVYSETTESMLETRLGKPEYSYYFVLKEFRPVLEALGRVVTVADPMREVDPIFHNARRDGEDCVFLSFTPPHQTALGLECPTIPVFAWEFETIPDETWFSERAQDWRYVFDRLGRAITHSATTVRTVQATMGQDFPVASIAAPVFDRFAALRHVRPASLVAPGTRCDLVGTVIDSRAFDLSIYARSNWRSPDDLPQAPMAEDPKASAHIELDGVVYVSIFNPYDGRKNWFDLMGGFCWAFRDTADATLILKLTHHECGEAMAWLLQHLYRLTPFKCRVILLHSFLDSRQYEGLVTVASYAVNASHGEGQCLPLMEYMACGKPAIAPCHTGMADYIESDNAFVVRSSAEPTAWPHDPRQAYRTLRHRINLESLVEAYRESYRVAKDDPDRYARMADEAHAALRGHCSRAVATERLRAFLATPARPAGPERRFGRLMPRADAPWIVEAPE
ncbi:Glycosyltransferase involved in cell wall bisynthesis [Rhizobiales bacterium GAS113]|jgi:glycosyltransferase involved in cell wall biosynthesis|nr:Glycosyltransferase involved in cell wall bisynthesis [Rhizobiales bacterium GAS113]